MNLERNFSNTKTIRMPARNLRIHPVAQRDLMPSNLKRITENLNLDALGTFSAVEYEIAGGFGVWIIDGQHRWRALMDRDMGDWEVDVKIYLDYTDDAKASALFLELNARAAVAPFDKFEKSLIAGDPEAVGVTNLLKVRGLTVSRNPADRRLCCVTALMGLYKERNGEILAQVIDTVMWAWGGMAAAFEAKLLEGLGLVLKVHGESIDYQALIKKLQKYKGGASGIIGDARGLMRHRKVSCSRCVAEIIIETYNSGRSTGRLVNPPPEIKRPKPAPAKPGHLSGMSPRQYTGRAGA